ncbi:MAG: ubiquinol-cytochrome c reductase iron-sulfur subunit [Deltaproteobacteria bacterium]|nr:ubiquinol-cytochrome c reductase iron-sulfur subunit [Deltaproteobacteria bacterium]
MSNDPKDEGRRAFLKVATGACGTAAAAAIGVPVVGAVLAPAFEETVIGASGFVTLVPVESLPADGTPMAIAVVIQSPRDAWAALPPTEVGTVFLARRATGVVAYSTICPHLGCQVDLKPELQRFQCPCHDSVFSLEGKVVSGPSPRALDELETRVVEGKIQVRYVRFKTGGHDKKVV